MTSPKLGLTLARYAAGEKSGILPVLPADASINMAVGTGLGRAGRC
jgi:hypothetical protein